MDKDKDKDNLWTRRANSSKLSLSMSSTDSSDTKDNPPPRQFPTKRFGGGDTSSHGSSNPFNKMAPLTTGGISSPTSGASSAFGLGSGAFGFGAKTPKTPGTAFDFTKSAATPSTPTDKPRTLNRSVSSRSTSQAKAELAPPSEAPPSDPGASWPLKYTWVIWYRPPTSKPSDYNPKAMCEMATAQQFWKVYSHLKRPSALPTVSDYHFFKSGIRPIWEDDENKKGGKWIMRLKKGVADRYWEELLMALIGDQFAEAGEEVCGAVVSVRNGEDVFSIWTKNDGGRNIKIRETIKRVLNLPPDTSILWKSHEESSTQTRPTTSSQNKGVHQGHERRRVTISAEDPTPIKEKASAA